MPVRAETDSDAEDGTASTDPARGHAQMSKGKNVHCAYIVDRKAESVSGYTLTDIFVSQNNVWERYIDSGVLPNEFGGFLSIPRRLHNRRTSTFETSTSS